MYRIRKKFTLEAAHQLETAVTEECHKCIHGHSYTVELVVACAALNGDKMVLDFACLKPFIEAMKSRYDHALLLHKSKEAAYRPLIKKGLLDGSKVKFFEEQPTAEVLARVVFDSLVSELELQVREETLQAINLDSVYVEKVRVHETGTGWAEYEGGDN